METFSALLTICAGNSLVPGEFLVQRPVTRSFDVFFYLGPNKRLSKQWWGWWFETSSSPLWHHCNVLVRFTPAGLIPGLCPANERPCYFVTTLQQCHMSVSHHKSPAIELFAQLVQANNRENQIPTLLTLCEKNPLWIHHNFPHKGPVIWKAFPCNYIMQTLSQWFMHFKSSLYT